MITGASGYIGSQLARRLASQGHQVHALYHSPSKARSLENTSGIRTFHGDILHAGSLREAVRGCDGVFHLAAYTKPWHRDPRTFQRYNLEGALNVFHAARAAGANRVVFTSTAGVINPSFGRPSTEDCPRTIDYFTEYERTKAQAEDKARELSKAGMEIITVNPSRVYGPGLLSTGNGVTRMLSYYLQGRFRIIPGDGSSIGNYAYIEDVIKGHIQAMDQGRSGERYILGGDNISYNDFFDLLSDISGKHFRMFHIPFYLLHAAASLMEVRARLTGAEPLLTPPWVKKYGHNWELSSEKAERELEYAATPLELGLSKTVDWLEGQR
jgi:farnesol dehydrogenase